MSVFTAPELQWRVGLFAVALLSGCDWNSGSDEPQPPVLPEKSTGRGPEIHVRILRSKEMVLLTQGAVSIQQTESDRILFRGKIRERSRMRVSTSGLQLEAIELPSDIVIRLGDQAEEAPTYLGLAAADEKRFYRGALRCRRVGAEIETINEVALEDYLRGVIGAEMPASYPLEALKAQAVASRTYALYSIRETANRSSPAVFHATPSFQVYGGIQAEHARVVRAVDSTSGFVMTYQGAIFRAYFHSTCGGKTTSASSMFKEPAIRPLEGVPCGRCENSRYFRWQASRTLDEIHDALQPWLDQLGIKTSAIDAVRVGERDDDGRVRYVQIISRDATHDVRADRFQSLVNRAGGERLRSLWYDVESQRGRVTFQGRGWGHGIGLCQVGAGVQGKSLDFRAILSHYYPGAQVERVY